MPNLNLIKTSDLKQCSKCRILKPHSEFNKHRGYVDGLYSSCKTCKNSARKSEESRKMARQSQKAWRDRPENKDKAKEWASKFRTSEYGQKYIKNDALLRNYGITLDQYNAMFAQQNGCCAICSAHQSEFPKSLCVDHNHKTGTIRQLLCSHCNAGLGSFRENLKLLDAAKEYLKNHNALEEQ